MDPHSTSDVVMNHCELGNQVVYGELTKTKTKKWNAQILTSSCPTV